jgi:hypothetical protein
MTVRPHVVTSRSPDSAFAIPVDTVTPFHSAEGIDAGSFVVRGCPRPSSHRNS